jgi:hypothetical protein
MKYETIREWTHTATNRRTLIRAEDGCFYVVSWKYSALTGNETLIVPAREDGSVIEWSDVVRVADTTAAALAVFARTSREDVVRALDH